jgi:hypothetical protein
MGCVSSKGKVSVNFSELELKLTNEFPLSTVPQRGDYCEIFAEITKQQTIKNKILPWMIYNQFENISYHSKNEIENCLNYFATQKNDDSNQKILLKELINSSHLAKDILKVVNKFN